MNLEEKQKRENRHIELIRSLDRLAGILGTIAFLLFILDLIQVCR